MNSGSTSSTTERRGAAHRHLAAVLVLAAAVLVSLIVPRFDWPCLDWPCLDRPCLDRLKWRARHLGHRPLWPVPSRLLSPSFFKTPTWGTYRPGYYFGLRRAAPLSTVAGLMWTHPSHDDALQSIRHEARQEHGIQKWGWQVHDGSTYGRQTIEDRDLALEIQWAKAPNDTDGWTARVSASSLNETRTSETTLFFYIGEEDVERLVHVDPRSDACTLQSSSSSSSSSWCASLAVDTSTPTSMHFVRVRTSQFQNLAGVVSQGLRYSLMQQQAQGAPNGYSLVLPDLSEDDPNVGIVQLSGKLPFSMDVTFRTGAATASASASAKGTAPPAHPSTNQLYRERELAFETRFNATFPLLSLDDRQHRVASYALSNMLGGIGYWHGSSLVEVRDDDGNGAEVDLWQAPLLSAVPSRSFFPRGFLWDEGFHHLLIRRWDPATSRAILAHWLDLMTASGWIPREQILGAEARSRVPDEFISQHPTAANPPTLFLALSDMAINGSEEDIAFLKAAWPRLDRWFRWYNTTQAGPVPGSYRWRGRDPSAQNELNPKTLTSGLDDYPRASHPSDDERHVDLRCWMAVAARTMSRIEARVLGGSPSASAVPSSYAALADRLEDYGTLKALHWDSSRRVFADYGLDTPDVVMRDGRRVVETNGSLPELGFVSQHAGYVTMFPLALKLIPTDAPELTAVLDVLSSPEHMWSPHGLRSLASSSPIYDQHNTKHDAPYWRGAIWINMNYLILDALRTTYAGHPRSREIADALRDNLVATIGGQYDERGFVFENYDDKTGEGRGCFPFTGWSALVALM